MIITLVYWGILYKILNRNPDRPKNWAFFIHTSSIHFTPLLALTVNYLMSTRLAFKLNATCFKYMLVYCPFYMLSNYLG